MIDVDQLAKQYREQYKSGSDQIKKGMLNISQKELRNNLLTGVVFEMIRIWLSSGIGKRKTRIRDVQGAPFRRLIHITAMLNRLEKHWKEFIKKIRIKNQDEYFVEIIKQQIPDLYALWVK
jgi:hypothetical protein